jgi:hypothetical protein
MVVRGISSSGQASTYAGVVAQIAPEEARGRGFSHVLQGTAADLLRVVLPELDAQLGDRGRVILPVHDGLLVEVQAEFESDTVALVKQVMEHGPARLAKSPGSVGNDLSGLILPVKVSKGWPR